MILFIIQVYSEQDTSKMPHELGNALSHEREPVRDPEIRKQALEAIYLISLQVRPLIMTYTAMLLCEVLLFVNEYHCTHGQTL